MSHHASITPFLLSIHAQSSLSRLSLLHILVYCLISQEVDTMHLTTLVSLLAVGAAAAPAAPVARSLDLNTRMVKPTLSNLGPLPEITNLVRRQEEDPVEEEDPEESSSSSSSSSSAAGLIPAIPTILRREIISETASFDEPTTTEEPSLSSDEDDEDDDFGREDEVKSPTETSTQFLPAPSAHVETIIPRQELEAQDDSLEAYLHTLDGEGDYDEDASERALDRYHASLDKDESNSTTSAVTTSTSVAPATKTPVTDAVNSTVPLDTKNVTSTDFDWKTLTGTADAPKKDVESLASTNTTSTEQPAVKNVTDTAAPLTTATQEVDSEKLVGTTETAKNETSTEVVAKKDETTSALPETSAVPATTEKAGPLGMLSGLIPVKRDEQPTLAPLPLLPPAPVIPTLPDSEELDTPVKRQLESLTGATPKEELPAPDVKEDEVTTPTVDETVVDSNSTAVNETVAEASATPTLDSNATAVNETAAETSATGSAGYANINKHMEKLSKIPLGLPIKRQAPDFITTPVAEPEIANAQPTGGLPTKSDVDADSPLHKFLVPLQR
jgi:hypothetical protein